MTLTKEAITRSVFDRLDVTKAASAEAVEAAFEIIKKTPENGEEVLISGFGKFCLRGKGKRRARNPGTGEELMLGERRVVTFKGSTVLMEARQSRNKEEDKRDVAKVLDRFGAGHRPDHEEPEIFNPMLIQISPLADR